MVVAECRLRGRGAVPERVGLLHIRESATQLEHKQIKRLHNHPAVCLLNCLTLKHWSELSLPSTRTELTALALTYVEDPQVSQATAAHASVDDEPGSSSARHHSRVALPRWRRLSRRRGDFPADDAGAWPQLQAVEVIQIPVTWRRGYVSIRALIILHRDQTTQIQAQFHRISPWPTHFQRRFPL